jgi:hypothetical protein
VENNLLSKEELTYLASLRSSTADPQPDEQDPGDEDPKNV